MTTSHQRARFVRTRGIQRMWDPRVWGTLVGAAGATVFVFSYRGALPAPGSVAAVIVWAVALLAYIAFVFVIPRVLTKPERVRASSGFIYLGSVAGMLLLIRLGTVALDNADRSELRAALIVVAVGLHFLPFAAAFHTPMFTLLGSVMAVVGAGGLVLGWFWETGAAAAMAVIAGIVMLIIITADAARTVKSSAPLG